MEIGWTSALELGVPAMDAQHRELVARVSRVSVAIDREPAEVAALLDFLGEYALSHFATEERLMVLHGYPEAAQATHRKVHEDFVRAFSGLRYDLDVDGVTAGIVGRIRSWMVGWLLEHIQGMDHALAMWIRSVGQGGPARSGTWLLPRAEAIEVLAVAPRGSLDRAGLEPGDFIVRVGGRLVSEIGPQAAVALIQDPAAGEVLVECHPGADQDRLEQRLVRRRPRTAAPTAGS
jgi:hemerythrin